MEDEYVNETITLIVNETKIPIKHDGIKPYDKWTHQSKSALQQWVEGELRKGKTEGWLPFANFEASVEFKINKINNSH